MVRENSHRLAEATDGKVTLVEFLDFECESCGAAHPAIEQLRQQYQGRVTFVVRHFPRDAHYNSKRAARAVEAAGRQGQFEAMCQKMFTTQPTVHPPPGIAGFAVIATTSAALLAGARLVLGLVTGRGDRGRSVRALDDHPGRVRDRRPGPVLHGRMGRHHPHLLLRHPPHPRPGPDPASDTAPRSRSGRPRAPSAQHPAGALAAAPVVKKTAK